MLGCAIPAPSPAAQTLILKGTNIGGVPTDSEYVGFVGGVVNGVIPTDPPVSPAVGDLVDYPASFWPVSHGGLSDPKWNTSISLGTQHLSAAVAGSDDDSALIFGYSQGAVVASQFKAATPNPDREITYVLLANPNRPNGGFLERFAGITIPILDVTATGATPAEGGTTYDIALQYDGWSDFPHYPGDLLATLNAIAGTIFLHGFANQQAQVNLDDLVDPTKTDIVTDGQTTYYTVPTDRLPILIPLQSFIPSPILTALDAPLRVLIEGGYDRSVSPGTPLPVSLIHIGKPIQNLVNVLKAIPVGIDDGLAEAAGDPSYRPLGTTPAGMYGVGGRELPTAELSTTEVPKALSSPPPAASVAARAEVPARHSSRAAADRSLPRAAKTTSGSGAAAASVRGHRTAAFSPVGRR